MPSSFKVVDLFAGPGGLAEGFSSYRSDGKPAFDVRLSVEKEASAFATLRLRSFVRQFGGKLPETYYRFLAGKSGRDQLISEHPEKWLAACRETLQLELGTPEAARAIDPLLDGIRKETGRGAILIGGPPCQAYSLVGRARNRGITGYQPREDHRHFLYREYIRIIGRLKPAAFIMENVKGFLSSKVDGERIFNQVLTDLRGALGSPDSYRIFPLVHGGGSGGQEYLLHAERFGVPQRRHRVILFGVRSDLAGAIGDGDILLDPQDSCPTVSDVLRDMPKLRSGLSKSQDSPEAWKNAVLNAFALSAQAAFDAGGEETDRIALRLTELGNEMRSDPKLPPRTSKGTASISNNRLAEWLIDGRLTALPNHEARGHMEGDLSRYAFAAVFAEIFGRSPKAGEFPQDLAPAHANWSSGKFEDRFRVQCWGSPSTTITSHISKDGHYFIHPDPLQCRSLTVREAARLQTFPDNYFFEGNRTEQYIQVGNAVPPFLAYQLAAAVHTALMGST